MKMSFNQYIQNPMGIANSVISNREMYRQLYTQKLDKIMVREAGRTNKMEYHLYKDGKRYIAYLKIPSEVVPEFYYDVLIEFTEPKGKKDDKKLKKILTGNNLDDYDVRFYSNDPSFVFTFAHAFVKNGIFFEDFADKMSKRAIKERAVEKNPKNIVGYVKSLYFAYLIMNRKGLFNKLKYLEVYNKNAIMKKVMHADKKIDERTKAAQDLSKKNKRQKEQNKRNRADHLEKELPTGIGKVNTIRKTPKVSVSNMTKNVNKTKLTKKVGRKTNK